MTAPGDLVVAGESHNGANYDAFLMRTTAGGIPIWNWAYDNSSTWGPARDGFAALTEAVPFGSQITGDLVAVGRYTDQTVVDRQGLAARVDGNTGIIGAAPQCMAQHGGNPSEEFYFSVAQLVTPPFAGQFVMVGATTLHPTWADDVWLTRGTPCFQVAQVRLGQSAGVTTEAGRDLREVLSPIGGGAAVGDLAITGYHGPTGGASRDAFLLLVRPGNLFPVFGNLYGDHALNNEIGVSLAQIPAGVPPGFIIAGTTPTDWAGAGDPSDLFLVNTDAAGHSRCDHPWLPNPVNLNWGSVLLSPSLRSPVQSFPVASLHLPVAAPWLVCP